jgi:hypothetical protein
MEVKKVKNSKHSELENKESKSDVKTKKIMIESVEHKKYRKDVARGDNFPYAISKECLEKLEYIKTIFGNMPICEVKENNAKRGFVLYNDNLVELDNDTMFYGSYESIKNTYDPIGYIYSLGLEQLPDGKFVKIEVMGGGPYTTIITEEETIKLIIKHRKFELLEEFNF